jgi:hypothetical protein
MCRCCWWSQSRWGPSTCSCAPRQWEGRGGGEGGGEWCGVAVQTAACRPGTGTPAPAPAHPRPRCIAGRWLGSPQPHVHGEGCHWAPDAAVRQPSIPSACGWGRGGADPVCGAQPRAGRWARGLGLRQSRCNGSAGRARASRASGQYGSGAWNQGRGSCRCHARVGCTCGTLHPRPPPPATPTHSVLEARAQASKVVDPTTMPVPLLADGT